jgi:pyruvate kinase
MWLLLDDGQFTLQVDHIKGNQIHCIILSGGLLSNNKVINCDGVGLSAYTLSLKDKETLKNAVLFTY